MTSSPQWRASTPPNEPAGPQTVTKFLLQVSTWFYSKYSNSGTLRTVLVRVWHFTSSLSFLVFSTACLTKVRTWFKACIRCSACHMKISGGLATVVHSCGHFCGEFGAVNVELQNLRLFGPELLRMPCMKLDASFSSCVSEILHLLPSLNPPKHSACLKKLFSSSASSWSFTDRSEKRTWQFSGLGDQESTAHWAVSQRCQGDEWEPTQGCCNVKRWIRMPPTLNAQANWLQRPISQNSHVASARMLAGASTASNSVASCRSS